MVGPVILLGSVALSCALYVLSALLTDVRRTWANHKASRNTGTPPARGCGTPSVSTGMKADGTLTPVMDTTAGFSFYLTPGARSVDPDFPAWRLRVSSSTERSSFGDATVGRGASGAPLESAA